MYIVHCMYKFLFYITYKESNLSLGTKIVVCASTPILLWFTWALTPNTSNCGGNFCLTF
jgi:hypothetical protein